MLRILIYDDSDVSAFPSVSLDEPALVDSCIDAVRSVLWIEALMAASRLEPKAGKLHRLARVLLAMAPRSSGEGAEEPLRRVERHALQDVTLELRDVLSEIQEVLVSGRWDPGESGSEASAQFHSQLERAQRFLRATWHGGNEPAHDALDESLPVEGERLGKP
jgi:ElaB/YqjD/DUF883 family membrane-anchored ribosome-binding protein